MSLMVSEDGGFVQCLDNGLECHHGLRGMQPAWDTNAGDAIKEGEKQEWRFRREWTPRCTCSAGRRH